MFLALRSQLLMALDELDAEITQLLTLGKSRRAAEHAKALLIRRDELAEELWEDFGVDVDPHPAMERLR